MKRIWTRAAAAAALCAVLLSGCSFSSEILSDHSAPSDPLTGQALQYPGERAAAVVIDNAPASTMQWGPRPRPTLPPACAWRTLQ